MTKTGGNGVSRMIRFPIDGVGVAPTTPYTVFVDESFDGFLGLVKPDGYFCYAALMVPTARLPDLSAFWTALRDRLVSEYKAATGFSLGATEFKSGYLNKLSWTVRRDMGDRLGYFLRKNSCFVGGFYTTVDGFALYHLRTEVGFHEKAKELPADWPSRLPAVKQKLLQQDDKTPGVAGLLSGLLHATLEISLNWLGCQGMSFEVVYDPRQKKEDAFLLKHAGTWLTDEKGAFKRFPGVFRGATSSVKSCDSPGLMLTDLILRDLRYLFADLPDLTRDMSTTRLILPEPQNDMPLIMSIKGMRLKAGSIRPMSPALMASLGRPTPNSMMPLYLNRLADTKLSCHAECGEARTIDFARGCFEDLVD